MRSAEGKIVLPNAPGSPCFLKDSLSRGPGRLESSADAKDAYRVLRYKYQLAMNEGASPSVSGVGVGDGGSVVPAGAVVTAPSPECRAEQDSKQIEQQRDDASPIIVQDNEIVGGSPGWLHATSKPLKNQRTGSTWSFSVQTIVPAKERAQRRLHALAENKPRCGKRCDWWGGPLLLLLLCLVVQQPSSHVDVANTTKYTLPHVCHQQTTPYCRLLTTLRKTRGLQTSLPVSVAD